MNYEDVGYVHAVKLFEIHIFAKKIFAHRDSSINSLTTTKLKKY